MTLGREERGPAQTPLTCALCGAVADGQLRWASASDQLAQAIEDNQEIFGQGPCMDAFAHARPAAMGVSRREHQWGEVTLVLADQLQVALDSRVLIERVKGALMERERLDEQEAFPHLRRAARSSGRKLNDVAREVAAGRPLPGRPTRPTTPCANRPLWLLPPPDA